MRNIARRIRMIGLSCLLLLNLIGLTPLAILAAPSDNAGLTFAGGTVEGGSTIAGNAAGFTPGEPLTALAHTPYGQTLALVSLGGTPATLVVGSADNGAALTADGNGAITFVFDTAANYQTGDWTIVIRGKDSGREHRGTFTLATTTPATTFVAPPATNIATPAARPTVVTETTAPTATPASSPIASASPLAAPSIEPTAGAMPTAVITPTTVAGPTTAPSSTATVNATGTTAATTTASVSPNPTPAVSPTSSPMPSAPPTSPASATPSASPTTADTTPTPGASPTVSAAPSASPSSSPTPSPDPSVAGNTPPANAPTTTNPGVPPPAEGPAVAPAQLLATFERAASLTGVPQEILLAIARVESNFSARAIGPFIPQLAGTEDEHALGMMQFLPSTYRMMMARVDAVTGKNLGMQGIWDPESAIYAAAFYLQDSGAPGNLRKALYAYNNADWYVDLIISWANTYAGGTVADPNVLNTTGGNATNNRATPQNPLFPSNSRHIDMQSPIQLYAPWTAGEIWHAGGDGSFYGEGFHADAYGGYYAIDFNKGAWPTSAEDDSAPILAAADGIINNIYQDSAGAWVVEIYHVAPDGSQLRTLYVHLKVDPRINPGIKVNQAVLHGTPIGLNGSSGESTGSHLHFGLWLLKDGQWVSIRAEPMEGQSIQNGTSITSTNRPVASDIGARQLDLGFSPNSPSNADTVTLLASGRAGGLPLANIEIYANTAKDGSIRGQWQPIAAIAGGQGEVNWTTAPLAEGTYRLLYVQTDAVGNRTYHGLTDDTAVRYTIRRGEPRGSIVANPRTDLTLLAPLDGAALATLGGRGPVISGPLRFGTVATAAPVATPLGSATVIAATGAPPSGKVREGAGLVIEEGTTNLITNPSFERGTEGWVVGTAPGSALVVTPVESALFGKNSLRLDNSKSSTPAILATTAGDGTLATWSVYARTIPVESAGTASPPTTFRLGFGDLAAQEYPLSATWQRFTYVGTSGGAATEAQIIVPAGAIIEIDGAQLETKPYATSYTDGSLGPGYGWAGVANASVSGRLATVVTLPLDGLVTAERGAVSFWATSSAPSADGATIFALGQWLTLTIAGDNVLLRWDNQTIATMPWVPGTTHQYALTWQGGTVTFLQDGQIIGQQHIATFALPTKTQLTLGSDMAGAHVANLTFQDLAVWQGAPDASTFATLASGGQFLHPGVAETVTLDTGLALAAQGFAPGGVKMQFSFDGVTWTDPEPFATSKTLTLPTQPGEVRIYVRLTDIEGRTIVSTDRVQIVTPAKQTTEAQGASH